MKIKVVLLTLLTSFLSSCSIVINTSSKESSSLSINSSSESIISSSISSSQIPDSLIESSHGEINVENWSYENFFNPATILDIKIHINLNELQAIQNDYFYYSSFGSKSPIYRKCNITFTIGEESLTLLEVGIRMKGNLSRTDFIDNKGNIYQLIHYKLSFSETFDSDYYTSPQNWNAQDRSERKSRTFLGMDKLDLKWNRGMDSTYIKENYMYTAFRESGVVAPFETLSPLKLQIDNGKTESLGLFYVIEAVDQKFIEHHFEVEKQGGDLYKAAWGNYGAADLSLKPDSFIGIEDEDIGYFPVYDLKTNKKNSQHQNLRNFVNLINNKSKEELALVLEDYLDVDNFLLLEAIAYMGGNPDDMRNNGNNYYIYFTKDDNKAVFIPYDWDWTLGVKSGWNPTGSAMTQNEPYTRMMMSDRRGQTNPLIYKTFIKNGVEKYQLQYREKLIQVMESPWFKDDSQFTALFNLHYNKYKGMEQPTISGVSYSYRNMALGTHYDEYNGDNIPFSYYLGLKRSTLIDNLDNYLA